MQNDPKCCSCSETKHGHTEESALTRVPAGHKRERERNLIRQWLHLRTTRQESGCAPKLEEAPLRQRKPNSFF